MEVHHGTGSEVSRKQPTKFWAGRIIIATRWRRVSLTNLHRDRRFNSESLPGLLQAGSAPEKLSSWVLKEQDLRTARN